MIRTRSEGRTRYLTFFSILLALVGNSPCYSSTIPGTQTAIRIALIGFAHSKTTADLASLETVLADAFGRDPRVVLVDSAIVRPALAGIGYDGSINMSRDEARNVGAAIACDFFVVGKAEALTRSERDNESHEEAYAGVIIVDGRTGALAVFDLTNSRASTRDAALQALSKALDERASGYVDRLIKVRSQALKAPSRNSSTSVSDLGNLIEDVPDEHSPRAVGFKPPESLNRVKPEYTAEAESSDITATVEAMVIFHSNGETGAIEITRWAGFGLDESSERAIRQLKFKPATRDGKPINVRAMIRYNFRRIPEPPSKLNNADPQPPEPVRDLRQIFKPTYRRPPR